MTCATSFMFKISPFRKRKKVPILERVSKVEFKILSGCSDTVENRWQLFDEQAFKTFGAMSCMAELELHQQTGCGTKRTETVVCHPTNKISNTQWHATALENDIIRLETAPYQ